MAHPGQPLGEPVEPKRRLFSLTALVSLGVAGGLLAFLITRFDVDLGAAWRHIKAANLWYFGGAVAVHYTTFVFRGARWRLLLQNAQQDGAPVPGVFYCSQLVLLGWFANAVSWLRLGDAYRAYLYHDEQEASFSRTIGTIVAERALDAVLIVVLLVLTVPFLVRAGGGVAWIVLGVAVALLLLLFGLLGAMTWSRERALRTLPRWLAEHYDRFQEGTLGSFKRVLPVTCWGLLGWLAEVSRLYLVVKALDLNIGLALVVFLALSNSLLSLAPTPGGFGVVETGVAGLAVRLSRLSSSAAAALVLVDRFISYVSIIAVGVILFFWRQVLHRRQPALRRAVSLGGVKDP